MDNNGADNSFSQATNAAKASSVDNKANKDLKKIQEKTNKLLVEMYEIGELVRKNSAFISKDSKAELTKALDKQLKIFKDQIADVKEIETVNLF